MNKKLLLSFIIGSCGLVTIPHWTGLYSLIKNKVAFKDDSEKQKLNKFGAYIFINTFYYGLLNMLITYLRMKHNYNIHKIYFIFSICSGMFIVIHNLYLKILWDSYTFKTTDDKILYGIKVFLKHFIIFNFIMKGLETYLNNI